MDGQSVWSAFVYACVAALLVLLSRAGLRSDITMLKAEVNSLKADRETMKIEIEARMKQSRAEFRAEVETAVRPIHSRMNSIDNNIAQIGTMVSTMLNRSGYATDTRTPAPDSVSQDPPVHAHKRT